MKPSATLLIVWILATVSGLVVSNYRPQMPQERQQIRSRNDALLDIFGQSRTLLARYLWFKMDIYHEVLDEQNVPVEKQAQVIPLLRLVTLLDPSLTDAYDLLAYDLVKGHGKIKEALHLLEEGLGNAPHNPTLLIRKALILHQNKQYTETLSPAEKAVTYTTEEFDILNANRLLYWSAKKVGRRDLMSKALKTLRTMRPDDKLWIREEAAFNS